MYWDTPSQILMTSEKQGRDTSGSGPASPPPFSACPGTELARAAVGRGVSRSKCTRGLQGRALGGLQALSLRVSPREGWAQPGAAEGTWALASHQLASARGSGPPAPGPFCPPGKTRRASGEQPEAVAGCKESPDRQHLRFRRCLEMQGGQPAFNRIPCPSLLCPSLPFASNADFQS